MNIVINRQVFLDELNNASRIIDIKSLTPATTAVFIEAGVDTLTIISANNYTTFKSNLNNENADLEIKRPGKILVKPKFIVETLRKLETEFVQLNSFEESELEIITEKTSLKIGLLDSDDFPLVGFIEKGVELKIEPYIFKQTINETISSINPQKDKVILTGMNMKVENKKIIFSTTDLFRISLKEVNISENVENINITIPHKTLVELSKLLEGVKKFKIVILEGNATFILDNKVLQTTLIDGKFPSVESAFPSVFQTSLNVNARKISKLLSRFEFPFEPIDSTVSIKITNESILFKTNADSISYEEVFDDFEIEGTELNEIRFNTKFLIDAIKTFDVERLVLKFVSPQRPMFISSDEHKELKQIILPTHIN